MTRQLFEAGDLHNKKRFFALQMGSLCTKFQVFIVFRFVRRSDTNVDMRAKKGVPTARERYVYLKNYVPAIIKKENMHVVEWIYLVFFFLLK